MVRLVQVALLAWTASVHTAVASEICAALRFDLATVSTRIERDSGSSALSDEIFSLEAERATIDSAFAEKGRGEAGVRIVDRGHDAECSGLAEDKTRLDEKLRQLEFRQLAVQEDASALAIERQQKIARALEDSGCSQASPLVATPGEEEASLVKDGNFDEVRGLSLYDEQSNMRSRNEISETGNLRTLCVRTCDGGFFPISSHASSIDFGRDAQTCSRMCPGTETELFFHGLEEESSEMRSAATGKPYAALPSAYRFKKRTPAGACRCNLSAFYKQTARLNPSRRSPSSTGTDEHGSIRVISTEANNNAGPSKIPRQNLRPYVPDARIRRVGPEFLPDDMSVSAARE